MVVQERSSSTKLRIGISFRSVILAGQALSSTCVKLPVLRGPGYRPMEAHCLLAVTFDHALSLEDTLPTVFQQTLHPRLQWVACICPSLGFFLPRPTATTPHLSQVRSSKRNKCGVCRYLICGKIRAMNL